MASGRSALGGSHSETGSGDPNHGGPASGRSADQPEGGPPTGFVRRSESSAVGAGDVDGARNGGQRAISLYTLLQTPANPAAESRLPRHAGGGALHYRSPGRGPTACGPRRTPTVGDSFRRGRSADRFKTERSAKRPLRGRPAFSTPSASFRRFPGPPPIGGSSMTISRPHRTSITTARSAPIRGRGLRFV